MEIRCYFTQQDFIFDPLSECIEDEVKKAMD